MLRSNRMVRSSTTKTEFHDICSCVAQFFLLKFIKNKISDIYSLIGLFPAGYLPNCALFVGLWLLVAMKLLPELLKVICNDFLPTWLKVVFSCLLQYKPVCVTNLDKLCFKMLKSTSLLVPLVLLFFGCFRHVCCHTRICLSCLRCYALLRLDKKLFILPVNVLRTLTFY